MDPKRIMVVYFSRSGITKKVAQELATILDADCEELIDRSSYKGLFGFIKAGHKSITKKMTDLLPIKHQPINYDLIVICSPMWAGNITPAARTYSTAHNPAKVAWVITSSGDKAQVTDFASQAEAIKGCLHLSGKEVKHKNLTQKLELFAASIK